MRSPESPDAPSGAKRPSPSKGRPRRCTWDEVLAAAERVMARASYKSLSMRALADELGISHPSLYTYFTHIEEVEVAVLKSIAAKIPVPTAKTAAQLRTQLVELVFVARDYALNYQGLFDSPVGSPAWLALMERSLQWIQVLAAYTRDERRSDVAYGALIAVAKQSADLERINGADVRQLTHDTVRKHFGVQRTAAKEPHLKIVAETIIDNMLPELAKGKP